MSGVHFYLVSQMSIFSSHTAGQCVDTLLEALSFENFVRAKECAKEILAAEKLHLVHHAAKNQQNNSILAPLSLFEFLASTHFQRDEELNYYLLCVAHLFLELYCMKAVDENQPMPPDVEQKLKNHIEELRLHTKEEQVKFLFELSCCMEALNLMQERDGNEIFSLIFNALSDNEEDMITANLLSLLPVVIEKGNRSWYIFSFYISWTGSKAVNDLNLLRSILQTFIEHLSILQISQTLVELLAHLAWNGNREIQLESVLGIPGLLFFSDSRANQTHYLNHDLWPVRLRAIEILSALTLHQSSRIATLATNSLLERRVSESSPVILPLFTKLEEQPYILRKWKILFDVRHHGFLEQNAREFKELNERASLLKAKGEDEIQDVRDRLERQRLNVEELSQLMTRVIAEQFEVNPAPLGVDEEPPEFFLCPIGLTLMEKPVVADDGNTYEEKNILQWIAQKGTSPLTNMPLSSRLVPNRNLREAIDQYRNANAVASLEPQIIQSNHRPGRSPRELGVHSPGQRLQIPSALSSPSGSPRSMPLPSASEAAPNLIDGQQFLRSPNPAVNLPRAVHHFIEAANKGDPYAAFYVGFVYSEDRTPERKRLMQALVDRGDLLASDLLCMWDFHSSFHPKNNRKAVEYYLMAANKDMAIAQGHLGSLYFEGNGVEKDLSLAFQWFLKAARNGDMEAQYNLGNCYLQGFGIVRDTSEAIKSYKIAAEKGHIAAQRILGNYYYNGYGVPKSLSQAAFWYEKAASQKDPDAQYSLGVCYEKGEGIKQDSNRAYFWYMEASKQGHPSAQYSLANCLYYGKGINQNYSEAVTWYRKAAEQENSEAQVCLGNCFYHGKGVGKNHKDAFLWFIKAAEQNNAQAQYFLGRCYAWGDGVEKDFDQAAQWYRKASDQGNPQAQYHLADAYFNGRGIEKDSRLAIFWYEEAAKSENSDAQYALAFMYDRGDGVALDLTVSLFWYQKAAENGNAQAQSILGGFYEKGERVAKDLTKAFHWHQKAATAGNTTSEYALGRFYQNGEGIAKNPIQAALWYQRAAVKGPPEAQYDLAQSFAQGLGIPQDSTLAAHWCRKAAELGFAEAQYQIGQWYEEGRGLSQDLEKAIKWYTQAMNQGSVLAKLKLGMCYEFGKGIAKDPNRAFQLYQEAADKKNAEAQYNIGRCYEIGIGVRFAVQANAIYWYRQAAEQGHAEAQFSLGRFYSIGRGIVKDLPKAISWYQKASEQGHSGAQKQLVTLTSAAIPLPELSIQAFLSHAKDGMPDPQCALGDCYFYGHGVPIDYVQALSWYRKAADQKHPKAEYMLGSCFANGLGVSKNLNEAASWYQKSAEKDFALAQSHLGDCYKKGEGVPKDDYQAANWYGKAAENGDANAQFQLGECFLHGKGLIIDSKQALTWYQKAADQGHENAKQALQDIQRKLGQESPTSHTIRARISRRFSFKK